MESMKKGHYFDDRHHLEDRRTDSKPYGYYRESG